MSTTTLEELRPVADRASDLGEHEKKQLAKLLAQAYRDETGSNLDVLAEKIGEWRRRKQFDTNWFIVPEKLMLVVSELGEAMEAFRHLPPEVLRWLAAEPQMEPPESGVWCEWESNFEEEIADTFIRLLDLCDALKIPVGTRIFEKMAKNEMRPIKHGKER